MKAHYYDSSSLFWILDVLVQEESNVWFFKNVNELLKSASMKSVEKMCIYYIFFITIYY